MSASHNNEIESRLHQVEEETVKLRKMLEESNALMKQQFEKVEAWQKEIMSEDSDAVMKQQFEKVEAWQKKVMSVCQDHNQKYTETKKLVELMKAESDFLRVSIDIFFFD